jgi:hypothetical protein
MNKCVALFLLCFSISSCASKHGHLKKELVRAEERFSYTDKNGQFMVKLSSGFNKKENTFFSKRILEIPGKSTDNILEQSVALSDIGSIKTKENILRPKLSQYNVWFEGKKYFTELKINPEKKAIDVKMVSPENQWNGTKQIKLPNTKALYCFFSQVVECAKTTGFLEKVIQKKKGVMNFYVIWEGYPYLSETYSDFPNEVLSKAQLEYDGKTKEGEHRLSLRIGGQSIFYVIDQNEQMKKMFWVSQGISMVSRLAKKTETGEELSEIGGSLE